MKARPIASLFVDAQNTFTPLCPDELPVPDGHLIVTELRSMAEYAQLHLASGDEHPRDALFFADKDHPQFSPAPAGVDMDIRWNPHAIADSFGADLLEGLPRKTEYDLYIAKGTEKNQHPYGACFHDFAEKHSTGLIEFLRKNNVVTILVGGLATDYCVKTSVLQLCRAGFNVIVNLAACRGISPTTVKQALNEMTAAGAVTIKNAKEIPAALKKAGT